MRAGLSWLRILGDLVPFLCLGLRSRTSLAAENLFSTRILSRAQGQASPGQQSDPPDVGAAQPLVQLAGRPDRREADDLDRLAPQGLRPLLALELRSWPATDPRRATTLDSENGAREPLLGRGADRKRAAAETRSACFATDHPEVPAEVSPGEW
jgi:hypothetical protein